MKKVTFFIDLKDKVTATLNKMAQGFKGVQKEVTKAKGVTERFGDVCKGLKAPNLNAVMDVVGRIGGEFNQAAVDGMGFEQSMADLSSITGIVGKELEGLSAKARKTGQESGLGADTAARAYSLLASQIEVAEIGMEGLDTLLQKSVTLAQASGMSLDASADALAGTVNQFGLGADQAERVINVLAAGSKYGAAEIEHLTQSFKVTGATASAMGLSVEETAGALEVLSQANLKGSEAGTALRNIILKLNTELGIDLGETSLGAALEALKPKLSDATYLSKVFGMENIAAAQFLIQNAEAVDEMTAKLTDTNTAQEQAAIRTNTTAQRMAELKAQIDDFKIGISACLGDVAVYGAVISENSSMIILLVMGFKALCGQLTKVNWQTVASTASMVAHKTATLAVSAATRTWAAVQKALNIVLKSNPIGIVITVLAALAAAVVYAYNNFEGFRTICDKVWEAVKSVASAVWDFLVAAFEKACVVIKKAWEWIKNFFGIEDDASAKEAATALDQQTKAIDANTEAKKKNKKVKIDFTTTGEDKGEEGQEPVANPASYKELGDAISYYEQKLQETKPTETETIALLHKKIRAYKDSQAAIEQQWAAANRPDELKTLRDIDAEIEFQQSLRNTATVENIAGIDATIARLEALRTALEDASYTPVGTEQIQTYEQLDDELSYYESKLKRVTETERVEVQKRINELRRLRSEWDETLKELEAPQDISRLNTIDDLEKAIGHYSSKQKKATASEIADIQRTINALKDKRDSLQSLADIPQMQQEVSDLSGLSGQKLKLELELIGLDGVKERIRSLQKMLDDTNRPLGGEQRKEVEKMLGVWNDYEKQLKKNQIKLADAWGSVKGIGNSVEGITDALEGNGNAWRKVTGLVDGFIGLYEGFKSVISIIKTLTAVSGAHATAKTIEAAAETEEIATNIASGTAAVSTSVATTAALGVETAAWSALAAARTFAAHAYLPFVGTSIAQGFIAMQQAVIQAVSIPKFANGALAYGPTLGIFGEYAGAANNPEVVAPLDRLKAIIGTDDGPMTDGKVEFRIKSRRLVGLLERENNLRRRR